MELERLDYSIYKLTGEPSELDAFFNFCIISGKPFRKYANMDTDLKNGLLLIYREFADKSIIESEDEYELAKLFIGLFNTRE